MEKLNHKCYYITGTRQHAEVRVSKSFIRYVERFWFTCIAIQGFIFHLSSYYVVSVALIHRSCVNFVSTSHSPYSPNIVVAHLFKQLISIDVTQSRLEDVQHGYVSKCWTCQVFRKFCISLDFFFAFCFVLSFNICYFLYSNISH